MGESADALYVAARIDPTHDLPVMVLDSYGTALPPPSGIVRQMVGGLFERLTSAFRSGTPGTGNAAFRDTAMRARSNAG